MVSTNPARGMRDFLPVDVRKREYVIGIIKEVYESYGFEPLETPAVENIETLTGKYGEEGNQLIFKILKRGEHEKSGEADLALRYDLTVPLARVVANRKNELPKFFKRYQIQPVWRADRPARGRYREFYQCDVDAIGSSSTVVEAELISAGSEILTKLGFEDFVIRINHRDILFDLLRSFKIIEVKIGESITCLDKIDKIGVAGVISEFENIGLSAESVNSFAAFYDSIKVGGSVSNREDLSEDLLVMFDVLRDIVSGKALKLLQRIVDLSISENSTGRLKIDPFLARGLSYYTGAIMEVNVPDLPGSLAGGGRYDGLIGMFGKEQIPACGFSLGLERILVVMDERNMFPPELAANSGDVMVTIWNEESIGESLKVANELRQQGLRVIVYPEADKLGKQFKYASQINVPYVCVLGESEIAEDKVTLKNMQTGDQETIGIKEAAERIATQNE